MPPMGSSPALASVFLAFMISVTRAANSNDSQTCDEVASAGDFWSKDDSLWELRRTSWIVAGVCTALVSRTIFCSL